MGDPLHPNGRRNDSDDQKALVRFESFCLEKLRKNSHKDHWSNASPTYLVSRLKEEVVEMEEALDKWEKGEATTEDVISECCDVALFSMFISDNAYHDKL